MEIKKDTYVVEALKLSKEVAEVFRKYKLVALSIRACQRIQ
jgi:hypothetical protein